MKRAIACILIAGAVAVSGVANARDWQQPSTCQAKAAYLQYLIASRDQGMQKDAIIDYDRQLSKAWKNEMTTRVFDKLEFLTPNLGQVIGRFYANCKATEGVN